MKKNCFLKKKISAKIGSGGPADESKKICKNWVSSGFLTGLISNPFCNSIETENAHSLQAKHSDRPFNFESVGIEGSKTSWNKIRILPTNSGFIGESFYYVNYGSSIIAPKVSQIISVPKTYFCCLHDKTWIKMPKLTIFET